MNLVFTLGLSLDSPGVHSEAVLSGCTSQTRSLALVQIGTSPVVITQSYRIMIWDCTLGDTLSVRTGTDECHNDKDEKASLQWFLVSDVVNMLLVRMGDGKDLATCSCVNRLWRQHVANEALWQHLVVQRWRVVNVQRPNDGPLAETGNFWQKKYAQWHRSGRQPSSCYSGDRFPAFAKTSGQQRGKKSALREYHNTSAMRAGLWANCSHTQDCSLKLDCAKNSLLGLHLVVQNFSEEPMTIAAHGVMLRLKTGAVCRPIRANVGVSGLGFLAVCDSLGAVIEDGSELHSMTHIVLKQWDFCVIGTCYFVVPPGIRFEHSALEICKEVVVEVTRVDDHPEIVAKFDESKIWKHYTEVNPQFWVFSERPNLIGYV